LRRSIGQIGLSIANLEETQAVLEERALPLCSPSALHFVAMSL
jgi:hypothetical protein